MNHIISLGSHGLCDLAFMVREDQVHATPVDVEMLPEVFLAHSGTFAVPTGEAVAPRRRPTHDMLRLGAFPKGEVDGVMLLVLPVQRTGRIQHILDIATREDAVFMIFIIFLYVEIDGALAFVSVAVIQNLLCLLYTSPSPRDA